MLFLGYHPWKGSFGLQAAPWLKSSWATSGKCWPHFPSGLERVLVLLPLQAPQTVVSFVLALLLLHNLLNTVSYFSHNNLFLLLLEFVLVLLSYLLDYALSPHLRLVVFRSGITLNHVFELDVLCILRFLDIDVANFYLGRILNRLVQSRWFSWTLPWDTERPII